MIKIGITGGIGSGKSTVSELWKSLGAYVLNADELAKCLMVENPLIKKQIIHSFGEKAYHQDGSLNRVYLAEEAFGKGRIQELNEIVHPVIPDKAKKFIDQAEEDGYPLFVYEAALLLQKGRPEYLDYIVLVVADKKKRLQRVMDRDDADRQAILDRMSKQQDFKKLENQADIIIVNNGTLRELKSKANQYYRFWLKQDQLKKVRGK